MNVEAIVDRRGVNTNFAMFEDGIISALTTSEGACTGSAVN
jgi:hypothetical protein